MSDATEQLTLRAEKLAEDLDAEMKTMDTDSVDYALLDKALPMAITVALLLKGTTDDFKASMSNA